MDNALLLYLKKLEQNMHSEFTDVITAISNVQLRVDDIYLGSQVSDWVTDLETFGTSSVTYGDPTRMNVIVANSSACKNNDISSIILDWAIANNKAGTYFGSIFENDASVAWNTLSTIANVMGNNAAFSKIANDSFAFEKSMNNSSCRNAIYNAKSVTESIINNSSVAKTELGKRKNLIILLYPIIRKPIVGAEGSSYIL